MNFKFSPGSEFDVTAPPDSCDFVRRVATEVVNGIVINLQHSPGKETLRSLYAVEMHEVNPWLMTADVSAPVARALRWNISEKLCAYLSQSGADERADVAPIHDIDICFSEPDREMYTRIDEICTDFHEAASRVAPRQLRYYICVIITESLARPEQDAAVNPIPVDTCAVRKLTITIVPKLAFHRQNPGAVFGLQSSCSVSSNAKQILPPQTGVPVSLKHRA